ncbi:MAG TPA: glycoside hydrolase family 97 protein [Terriglobales bacterium]|jgi:alpha-glucosidase|nr:glycoside hydrolase family 97 protein [Terriglobales bacterium]
MNILCKKAALVFVVLMLAEFAAAQASYSVFSPNKQIEVKIHTGDRILYDVLFKGTPLLQKSTFSIDIDHNTLGVSLRVKDTKQRTYDGMLEPAVRQKFAKIRENYNELRLEMEGNYAVVFRAYNEGVAYRFETSLPQNEVKVYDEEASFNFAGDYTAYYPLEESFFSHNERKYLPFKMSEIPTSSIASLPAVVDTANGVKVAVAESDIEDYPGLWLKGTASNGLAATFPHYPLQEVLERDRDYRVTETADYIAVTKGTRTYPWRLLGIAEKDGDLITNQLVWLLEKPSQVQDTSWIKPGKVAWDWWNALNIEGVDFKSGVNTQTYKYYIDFAAKYGLQYIILDEGWYKLGDVLEVVPEINMEELTAYAKQKNVGVILWVVWKSFDDKFDAALDQFQKWGIAGIKIDFMQRDDQKLINFYYKTCRETAKRHMLVDFHGGQSQVTMTRTWPNMISGEGVRGMEWSKWSAESEPQHNVTLPFTRMFLGPMDYTPGAMLNATKTTFAPIHEHPMAMGTRCHQLAMYVVFESPLQMLSDSPSNYMREPEAMEFLTPVPSVWDETRVLDAKLGKYVLVARRSGRDWYVGAMTNWTGRDLDVDLSFLPPGTFSMDAYQDGVNADRNASDYKKTKTQVSNTQKLKITLAPGGGWAARIHR